MKKKIIPMLMAAMLVLQSLAFPVAEAAGTSKGITIQPPSAKEVADYWMNYKSQAKDTVDVYGLQLVNNSGGDVYKTLPTPKAPFDKGDLTNIAREDTLHIINTMRKSVNLPAVSLDASKNEAAQAGAYLNFLNNDLSHSPVVPSGMTENDALYKLGLEGAMSSNIGSGHTVLSQVFGYMRDNTSSFNRTKLGHRRWLLNPTLKTVGIGMADRYTAIYVLENIHDDSFQKDVYAWPNESAITEFSAPNTPLSVMIGTDYDISESSVVVEDLVKGTNKTYTKDSGLTINENGYGYNYALSFGEELSISPKSHYRVTVNGVKLNGADYPISYEVKYHSLEELTKEKESVITTRQHIETEIIGKQEITYIETNELAPGVKEVVSVGIPAKVKKVYNIYERDGVEVKRELVDEITIPAVNGITRIGMPYTFKEDIITEKIPFEVEERDDNTLPLGETKILTEGQEGQKEIHYSIKKQGDKVISKDFVKEIITRKPTNKVILHGTKEEAKEPVKRTETEKKILDIDFDKVVKETDELPIGTEIIDVKGQPGRKEVTYLVKYEDDKEISRTIINEDIIKEPVNEIKLIGTKPKADIINTDIITEESEINFKTVTEESDELFVGESEVKQEGISGTKEITYEVTYTNGKETNRVIKSEEVIKKPQDKVVIVGTKKKPVITKETIVEAEEIAFDVVKQESNNLDRGTTRVLEEGLNGKKEITYKVTYVDGKETNRELIKEVVVESPVNRVVLVGTREYLEPEKENKEPEKIKEKEIKDKDSKKDTIKENNKNNSENNDKKNNKKSPIKESQEKVNSKESNAKEHPIKKEAPQKEQHKDDIQKNNNQIEPKIEDIQNDNNMNNKHKDNSIIYLDDDAEVDSETSRETPKVDNKEDRDLQEEDNNTEELETEETKVEEKSKTEAEEATKAEDSKKETKAEEKATKVNEESAEEGATITMKVVVLAAVVITTLGAAAVFIKNKF